MLRVAARKYIKRSLNIIRQQSTEPSKHSYVVHKWSGVKKLTLSIGVVAAGAGGFTGYAYYYPEFRKRIEVAVPQFKVLFDTILGETSSPYTKQNVSDIKNEVAKLIPRKKIEEALPPIALNPPLVSEKKEAVHVDPVDIKDVADVNIKPLSDATHNKELEASLLAAIQSAESRVHLATDAKIRTINAIDQHSQLMKQTVDDMQHADWEKVTSALQNAQSLANKDSLAEIDSRNYIDNLRKIISEGKSNASTSNNPLLLNAIETANKLSHQLDELNSLVLKARQDSTVLNNYKDLVERSREQFAIEMKNILPNVDIHAKENNLTEEELNALIAHAHLKVDQLRRQLTEQQVREEQHIAQAIEDQKRADERVAGDRLNIELIRLKQQQDVDLEKALLMNRSSWELEMEEQLKRTAAAHSEHLEKVVRTQRQLFEIEQQQKVEDAIIMERDNHSRQIGIALSRLDGIEAALNSRVAMDSENRRAKQFWIACHNLIDNIKHGNKGGVDMEQRRFPLSECLDLLQEANSEDSFVTNLLAAFPLQSKEKGVYTEQDLKNRFNTVYKLGRRTASIDDNGGGLFSYMWSYVRSIFLLDLPRTFTDNDKIDPQAIGNLEILARARWFMERGDMEGAIRVFQLLRGEPARLARDWIIDTRTHLESRLLAQLLVAHAAVSSIRSTY